MSDNEINSWLQSRTYIGNEYTLDPEKNGRKDSPRERACALYTASDRVIIRDCRVVSKQDTIGINKNRIYFENCFLEGTTDYICGGAVAVMNNCTLNVGSAKPMDSNTGATDSACITAAGQSSGNGYLFYNCEVTGTDWATPSELGRPWNANAEVTYINTKINKCKRSGYTNKYLISDKGWTDMGDNKAEDARFGEYGSVDAETGKAITSSVSIRKKFMLNEWSMLEYNPYNYLRGSDNWDPSGMNRYYSEFDENASSINIDTSGEGDIILPEAADGYGYQWESDSTYASVDKDKNTISIIRPLYGDEPVETNISVYIRKNGTQYGAKKVIPLTIQPHSSAENTFSVNGTVSLSSASKEEVKVTVTLMQGGCPVKTLDVTVPAGQESADYAINNLPEGSYTAQISTDTREYTLMTDSSVELSGRSGETKELNISLSESMATPYPAKFTVDDLIKTEDMMRWSNGVDVTTSSDSTKPLKTASSASATNLLVKTPENYTAEYEKAFGPADSLRTNFTKKLGYINFCAESEESTPSIDTYISVYFSVSEEQAAKGPYKVYVLTNRKRNDSRISIETPKVGFVENLSADFVNMSTDTDGTGVHVIELPEFKAGTYEFKWYPVRTADGGTKVASDFFALRFLPVSETDGK